MMESTFIEEIKAAGRADPRLPQLLQEAVAARLVSQSFPSPGLVDIAAEAVAVLARAYCDASPKLRSALGPEPAVAVGQAIARMCAPKSRVIDVAGDN